MPQLLHTPRAPFTEVSPNSRSRVVILHDYRIQFADITRGENLQPSTYSRIFQNAQNQDSCKSRPRKGCLQSITLYYSRQIFRVIAVNPKITAAQLYIKVALQLSKKTIYRFLKKSGIQK
jgi:hypothetical protein